MVDMAEGMAIPPITRDQKMEFWFRDELVQTDGCYIAT